MSTCNCTSSEDITYTTTNVLNGVCVDGLLGSSPDCCCNTSSSCESKKCGCSCDCKPCCSYTSLCDSDSYSNTCSCHDDCGCDDDCSCDDDCAISELAVKIAVIIEEFVRDCGCA